MTAIKYLQMNHILVLNVSLGIDMPLNKSNYYIYYVHFWANTLGKSMNPLILSAMG